MFNSEKFAFKELEIGQFFLCKHEGSEYQYYGIKLSPSRYFDLDANKVFGFYAGRANDSDEKAYIKCDYEVW